MCGMLAGHWADGCFWLCEENPHEDFKRTSITGRQLKDLLHNKYKVNCTQHIGRDAWRNQLVDGIGPDVFVRNLEKKLRVPYLGTTRSKSTCAYKTDVPFPSVNAT